MVIFVKFVVTLNGSSSNWSNFEVLYQHCAFFLGYLKMLNTRQDTWPDRTCIRRRESRPPVRRWKVVIFSSPSTARWKHMPAPAVSFQRRLSAAEANVCRLCIRVHKLSCLYTKGNNWILYFTMILPHKWQCFYDKKNDSCENIT